MRWTVRAASKPARGHPLAGCVSFRWYRVIGATTRTFNRNPESPSVRAVPGRSPRSRGVRAVGVVGGAQLNVLRTNLGEPSREPQGCAFPWGSHSRVVDQSLYKAISKRKPRSADFRNVRTSRLFSARAVGYRCREGRLAGKAPTDPWGPPRSALTLCVTSSLARTRRGSTAPSRHSRAVNYNQDRWRSPTAIGGAPVICASSG